MPASAIQKIWIPLLVALAAVFVFSVSRSAGKPFTLDETDLAHRAHLINREGPFPRGFVTGAAEALTHPPLYDFVLASVFRAFGERETPARLFGVVNYLLIGLLSLLTLRHLLRPLGPDARGWPLALLAAALLANPLLVQHAMLIDADTTGTALCAALFLFIFVRTDHWTGGGFWASRAGLALVTGAMFLFKEADPFLIFGGIAVYRLLNREFKKLLIEIPIVLGGGALLAWTVWSAYAHALGMDPLRIYASQDSARYSRISRLAFLGKVFKALPAIVRWPVYWNSLPLVALLLAAFALRARRFFSVKKPELVDALWLASLPLWTLFLLLKPSIDMMKYQFPVYAPMLVAAAYAVAAGFAATPDDVKASWKKRWEIPVVTLAVCAGLLAYYFRLGDYILLLFNQAHRPIWIGFVRAYSVPLAALVVAALVLGRSGKNTLALWLAGLFAVSLPIQTALNLRQAEGRYTTVESWMNYGERGLAETVDHLAARTQPGTITSVRKDIRYYLEVRRGMALSRNMDPRDLFMTPEKNLPELENFLKRAPMDFVVTDPISLLRLPEERVGKVAAVLAKHYEPDRAFGSFKVYKRRTGVPSGTAGEG